jgi:hypothetical protein
VLTFGPQHAIDSISCGRDHTLALLANGKVFGWGGDGSGRLPPGIPEYCSTSNPATRAVEIETRHSMTSVSAGHGISLGITVTKRVLVWGANPAAAGGWGSPHALVPPRRLAELVNVRAIVAGEFLFGAIDDAGAVHTWGLNAEGALGRPTPHLNSVPGTIASLAPASELTLGKGYMLALTRDGQIHAWGNNAAGQLGLGNLSSVSTPLPLPIKTTIRAVAAGATHSLAIAYDTTGKGWWLTLITDSNPSPGVFTADLFVTTGPPFNAVPFVKTSGATKVGTATLTFTDASNGTFHYEVNLPSGTVSETKAITQQQLAAPPLASCSSATQPLTAATNYQEIWWAGTSANAGTEQGWGINFTHQGDIVFASWFTYDLDGTPLWVVAIAPKTAPGVYKGDLFRPSGPRFDAYDENQWKPNDPVGSLTLTFVNGNNATMDYTLLDMATQHKLITRQVFSGTGTACK